MDDWRSATVGDLVTLQRGMDLPDADRRPGPIPIMGSFGVTGRHDQAACKGPGVTVGRSGASIGVVNYVEGDYWPLNTCLYVREFHGNNPRYAYYFLKTIDLRVLNSGSAQPSLNRNFVHPVPILIPPGREQDAIAAILGALDDKIDLNRRMNETLEAMARAIFKDWFADFGPTCARMEGRPPYLAPEVWALFPDRLDDERKPEGWRFTKLGDLCARIAMGPFGSDITTDNFVNHGVPIIRGGNLKNGFVDHSFVYVTEAKADALRNANAFPQDIIITHRGTLGQVGIIPTKPAYPRYIVSQSQMLLTANSKITSPRLIFEFLRSERGMQQLLAFTSQVGVPAIARPTTSLRSLNVLSPSQSVLLAFDSLLTPLVEGEAANIAESRTLVDIRELLLPKLMSGEVRVKDAEKIAEAAL
jgi:type I restriction enzyme S subunit